MAAKPVRHNEPWEVAEITTVEFLLSQQKKISTIARLLERTEKEVLAKIAELQKRSVSLWSLLKTEGRGPRGAALTAWIKTPTDGTGPRAIKLVPASPTQRIKLLSDTFSPARTRSFRKPAK